jgi:ribosomal protein S8
VLVLVAFLGIRLLRRSSVKKYFMQNFRDAGFIKSYSALLKLPITVSEKSLMELVLSYTDKGNTFYMNYKDIAPYLSFSKVQSVKNVIYSLRKKGYINTKQSHNFNGFKGGSSTSIIVNEDLIELQLKSIINEENQAILGDLSNNIETASIIAVSSEITEQSEDNSLEYDFDKMIVLCGKSNEISSMINDFIPKDDDFDEDKDFYIELEKHMKVVFKNVVLQRSDFKELYRSIKFGNVETES